MNNIEKSQSQHIERATVALKAILDSIEMDALNLQVLTRERVEHKVQSAVYDYVAQRISVEIIQEARKHGDNSPILQDIFNQYMDTVESRIDQIIKNTMKTYRENKHKETLI